MKYVDGAMRPCECRALAIRGFCAEGAFMSQHLQVIATILGTPDALSSLAVCSSGIQPEWILVHEVSYA